MRFTKKSDYDVKRKTGVVSRSGASKMKMNKGNQETPSSQYTKEILGKRVR
jgi:hypothetical protein